MLSFDELRRVADRRFQRGQVDEALWTLFRSGQTPAPAKFLGRIRKLIDVDRKGEVLSGAASAHAAPHAFHTKPPRGQGYEAEFSPFDAFCIALALELLDLGFKQSEIVFLIRHIRGDLQRQFAEIIADPPAGRMTQETDKRVFMAVGKVELVERTGSAAAAPFILKPQFARGLEEGSALIDRLGYGERKTILLEIGNIAVLLCNALNDAPARPKGRPRKS
jgi:hypothetical protein